MAILQMTIDVNSWDDYMWFDYLKFEGNWIVDWGDGTIEVNEPYHKYKEEGTYRVAIEGKFKVIGTVEANNIVSIDKEEASGISFFYPLYLGRV